MLLKELEEEATYLYHPDHLGSVSVVSDQKGLPYERVEYLPFGEVWIEETDPATGYKPFRFTSKELDEETGLYYHGARYYEPTISRWMSADPAGWVLINPMDEDGEPVPDGWPEGFGPGPSVGMKPDYSIVEATNWYAYVSNNPVIYVDPTGKFTFSIGLSGQGGAGGGGQTGFGFVVSHTEEDGFETGSYISAGAGALVPFSGTLNVDFSFSRNDSIEDLSGFSLEPGFTIGVMGLGIGFAVNTPVSKDDSSKPEGEKSKTKPVFTISFGLVGQPGFELHLFGNATSAAPFDQREEKEAEAATNISPSHEEY